MKTTPWLMALSLCTTLVWMSGCEGETPTASGDADQTTSNDENAEDGNSETVSTANAHCPIMIDNSVSADTPTVEWNGKTIGFCCPGCDKKFQELSDEEKEAALAKAAEKATEAGGEGA